MQVAVEDAEEHGALEERDQAGAHDRRRVDAGGLHALDVVEREAVEPLHHQHPPGDELGMGAGHDEGPLVGLGEDAGDVEHVLGLEAEVELLDDGLGEQLDQRRRVGQGGRPGCGRRARARSSSWPRGRAAPGSPPAGAAP